MGTFSVTQEGSANALALNKDNNQVVIAGRNVFKVFSILEDTFLEVCNLRVGKNLNLNYSCNDVAWSAIDDNYLATAATNGAVVLWNLGKNGRSKQEHVFSDHKRTVNKVSFHPNENFWLISGSQDGTMKCFDLRVKEAIKTFLSNTESVRDVQFSPLQSQIFSAVSENGNVQLWDIRRPDKCQTQFTAHSGPVFACDWHPENNLLATASRDKTIKIWDLTIKPSLEYTIHTIASIGRVKWRPQKKYHIASCALVVDSSINIWDIRRPYIPYASFPEHKDISTGIAFKGDPDFFLSTSRDCTLYHHHFKDGEKPALKANPQAVSVNNRGEVLVALKKDERPRESKSGILPNRKSSPTGDQFHIASSTISQFSSTLNKDHNFFYVCAQKYLLSGRSLAEICDHNALVTQELGKLQISLVWSIIKTLYAPDHSKSHSVHNIQRETENNNNEHLLDSDHKSQGNNSPINAYSAGDEETEYEDHQDNFNNYTNSYISTPLYRMSEFQLPKGDFCFGENELDIEFDRISNDLRNGLFRSLQSISEQQQEDWTLPTEAFPLRHEIQNRSPPPENFPNSINSSDFKNSNDTTVHENLLLSINNGSSQNGQVEDSNNLNSQNSLTVINMPKMTVWNPNDIVIDALKYHATVGDVQTAASVLLVLGEKRVNFTNLDENTIEHWMLGYIDLLCRYRLWNIATQVIKLSWIPSVSQLNQQSTTIHTNCGHCSKPLQRSGWLCDRCHSSDTSLCSVCHQVVRGLYVWCQGCSHGGHLPHLQSWISKYRLCPTGCGHACEYT